MLSRGGIQLISTVGSFHTDFFQQAQNLTLEIRKRNEN
jgi:hypothetical protein